MGVIIAARPTPLTSEYETTPEAMGCMMFFQMIQPKAHFFLCVTVYFAVSVPVFFLPNNNLHSLAFQVYYVTICPLHVIVLMS